jgi:hypothetical protein
MSATVSQAMISSSHQINAERLLVEDVLQPIFHNVILDPENAIAGTDNNQYLDDVGNTDFMVVLLGQKSRKAVVEEIKRAFGTGAYIAGYKLMYPPFYDGNAWKSTYEEKTLKKHKLFVKSVNSIIELRDEVLRSVGDFLAKSTRKLQFKRWNECYSVASDWLKEPKKIRRVGLIQRTSTCVLGPRSGANEEISFCKNLELYVKLVQNKKKGGPYFVHIFDVKETCAELKGNSNKYLPDRRIIQPGGALSRVSGMIGESNSIHICPMNIESLTPLILVDNKIAYGVFAGGDISFVTVAEDPIQANTIWEIMGNRQTLSNSELEKKL